MIDSKKNKRLIAALLFWGILILASAISLWKLQKSVGNFDVSEMFPYVAALSSITGCISFLYLSRSDRGKETKINDDFMYSESLRKSMDSPKKQDKNPKEGRVNTSGSIHEKDVDDENTANEIKHSFLASEERITNEIKNLKRRATINLSWGVVLSSAALLFFFFFFLIYNEEIGKNLEQVFIHFVPRLGLVVFVELLAYFFLRLYKTSLVSIQYYHNELTNIETKKIAAIVAIKHCDEAKIWQTVECLLKVERNVLLKGKETTIQMEMLKMQNEYDNNMINSMKSMLEKLIDKVSV